MIRWEFERGVTRAGKGREKQPKRALPGYTAREGGST